ncbi:TPA: hypothetical protein SMF87_004550 [Serratia marcescens]|nr:hypothetical protein [Serratia marcescens]
MRPSDLVKDFGNPVAYYPGLVKHLGSVNAVILFCQFFYWTGKESSDLGIFKTTEEIERETGLTYEEQLNARKKLKRRGVLKETNKRLEHRIYYRIDTEKLDAVLSQVIEKTPNGQSPDGEMAKAQPANTAKPNPPTGESPARERGKPDFVHTENTTEITSQSTAETSSGAGNPAPAGQGVLTGEVLPKQQHAEGNENGPSYERVREVFWERFDAAYQAKYSITLPRNAKTNSQVKQLIQRLGKEAPAVAVFYVTQVNEQRVVMASHTLDFLLLNAEGYRTQWANGRSMTNTRARQVDQSQANYSAAAEAKAILRAQRANGGRNAG